MVEPLKSPTREYTTRSKRARATQTPNGRIKEEPVEKAPKITPTAKIRVEEEVDNHKRVSTRSKKSPKKYTDIKKKAANEVVTSKHDSSTSKVGKAKKSAVVVEEKKSTVKNKVKESSIEQAAKSVRSRRGTPDPRAKVQDKDQIENKRSSRSSKKQPQVTDTKKNESVKKGKKKTKETTAASETSSLVPVNPPRPIPAPATNKKYVGAHVSIAGGLQNAVANAVAIGAKSFALFLRSQRQWNCEPLKEEVAAKFRSALKEFGFSPHLVLPHGSYLLNCGSPDEETLRKSRETLVDELIRCERLGLPFYNFHPGSSCGEITQDECISRIADTINYAHERTRYCTTVVENMSGQGSTIGGSFYELGAIISKVKDKSRVGICLDTCHAHAAGYNLATEAGYNAMMTEFEKAVGFQYLKGVHVNDSKGETGCHLDRHENIGQGTIGKMGFMRVMKDPRFNDIPLILETPAQTDATYGREIKLLYSLELEN